MREKRAHKDFDIAHKTPDLSVDIALSSNSWNIFQIMNI